MKNERGFNTVKKYPDKQRFYSLKNEGESYAAAARIYLKCRKRGMNITSTIDCLIAQTALENNLLLLHNDSDIDKMQIIVSVKVFKLQMLRHDPVVHFGEDKYGQIDIPSCTIMAFSTFRISRVDIFPTKLTNLDLPTVVS